MNGPLISLCGTMYNNAKTIDSCIEGLSTALRGLNYEIVIVDNFSSDGSFERLTNFAQRLPVKLYRHRCLRGVGKTMAFRRSKGDFIVTIDLDTSYNPRVLRTVIKEYLQSKYNDKVVIWPSCFSTPQSEGTDIYPRNILTRFGGWRDLNRAEDNDLLAKLCAENLVLSLPVEGAVNESVGLPNARFVTFFRESRYAKGLVKQLIRLFRSDRDTVFGNALTVRKTIVLSRDINHASVLRTAFMCLNTAFFGAVCKASGMEFNSADRNLSNGVYILYKKLVNVIDPREFNLKSEDIIECDVTSSPMLHYLNQTYPEVAESIVRIQQWKHGNTKNDHG